MNFNFVYTFSPITEKEIEAFEAKFSVKIPECYKQFLLRYNGGEPEKKRFETVDKKVISHVMLFLPISKDTESNLENFYKKYCLNNIIPPHFIPIGIDARENPICLSTERPEVYFCNMTYFEQDGNVLTEENIKLVSDNFSSFLNSLYEPR